MKSGLFSSFRVSFLPHLPPAVPAFIFIARRVRPSLSLANDDDVCIYVLSLQGQNVCAVVGYNPLLFLQHSCPQHNLVSLCCPTSNKLPHVFSWVFRTYHPGSHGGFIKSLQKSPLWKDPFRNPNVFLYLTVRVAESVAWTSSLLVYSPSNPNRQAGHYS